MALIGQVAQLELNNVFTNTNSFAEQVAFNKTGVAPFSVKSNVMIPNLNADMVDGVEGAVITNHVNSKSNPHGVTKAQIGLGSVVDYGIATEAEAKAGTATNKYVTVERARQVAQNFGGTSMKCFTANGTFTVPTGVTMIYITATAAGGNGSTGTTGGWGISPGAGVTQASYALACQQFSYTYETQAPLGSAIGGLAGEGIVKFPMAVTPGQNLSIVCGTGNTQIGSLVLKAASGGTVDNIGIPNLMRHHAESYYNIVIAQTASGGFGRSSIFGHGGGPGSGGGPGGSAYSTAGSAGIVAQGAWTTTPAAGGIGGAGGRAGNGAGAASTAGAKGANGTNGFDSYATAGTGGNGGAAGAANSNTNYPASGSGGGGGGGGGARAWGAGGGAGGHGGSKGAASAGTTLGNEGAGGTGGKGGKGCVIIEY